MINLFCVTGEEGGLGEGERFKGERVGGRERDRQRESECVCVRLCACGGEKRPPEE